MSAIAVVATHVPTKSPPTAIAKGAMDTGKMPIFSSLMYLLEFGNTDINILAAIIVSHNIYLTVATSGHFGTLDTTVSLWRVNTIATAPVARALSRMHVAPIATAFLATIGLTQASDTITWLIGYFKFAGCSSNCSLLLCVQAMHAIILKTILAVPAADVHVLLQLLRLFSAPILRIAKTITTAVKRREMTQLCLCVFLATIRMATR